MKRSISAMVGKGSVNHNSRVFHAANTDLERSYLNVSYSNENIHAVYHELFDEALDRFNEKQTRSDRRIEDYYEKIRSGKQEKPFHELILQIGNKDDMNAATEDGTLAIQVLDSYMRNIQYRNPNLRVFSAHLHMDEATPHLHIDFVPFTTGSKRGMDTRVSLKQALASQGFKGGSRGDTEWNQWVQSEKENLSAVMLEHGIKWERKDTHQEHLSVLDFKKQERTKEVSQLEEKLGEVQSKATMVQDVDEIAVKPTLFDNSKLVVLKEDFEDVKTLAQKHIVAERKETALVTENKVLKWENRILQKDNFDLRQELSENKSQFFETRLMIGRLEAKIKQLQRLVERMLQFVEKLGLKQQLEKFLKQKNERER